MFKRSERIVGATTLADPPRRVTIGADARRVDDAEGAVDVGIMAGAGLFVKTVTLPAMPVREAVATVALTERSVIPFPPERTRIALLGGGPSSEPEGRTWLMAAVDKAVADPLVRRFGVKRITCVPAALAALRRHDPGFTPGRDDLFVSVDTDTTGVCVVGDAGILFVRESRAPFSPDRTADEIGRGVAFWRRTSRADVRVWLVGERAREMVDAVAGTTGLTPAVYDPARFMTLAAGIDGPAVAPLIGAALGKDDLDLTVSWTERCVPRPPRRLWPVAVAATMAGLMIAGGGAYRRIEALDETIARLSGEVAALEREKAAFDEANRRVAAARAAHRPDRPATGLRLRWSRLYGLVADSLPADIALTAFSVDDTDDGPKLTLEGIARGGQRRRLTALWELVRRVEDRLADGPPTVTLGLEAADGRTAPLRFTLSAPLRTVGVASAPLSGGANG
jgi:outer membrane murein-binding lipoprotein Lpp